MSEHEVEKKIIKARNVLLADFERENNIGVLEIKGI
jgi:hypothetical protein